MKFCLVTGVLLANSALASNLPLDAFDAQAPLSDQELAQQRGKYTQNGQDFYFGLLMQTQYLNAQGVAQQVSMQIEMSASNDRPELVITIADKGALTDNSLGLSTSGQASGLQQQIQITGDFNNVNNQLDITQGALAPLANGVEIILGQTLVNSSGNVLYSAKSGELGYRVDLQSASFAQGVLSQEGNGQLMQSINIIGGFNQITNSSLIRYQGIDIGIKERQLMGLQVRDIMGIGL